MDVVMRDDDGGQGYSRTSITPGNTRVITFIETTFNQILEDIQKRPCGQPAVKIRRIVKISPFYDIETSEMQWDVEDREVVYGWPGKNGDEAWRFGKPVHERLHCITNGISLYSADPVRAPICNSKRYHHHEEVCPFTK